MSRQFGVSVVLWYSAQVVSGVFSDSQCSKMHVGAPRVYTVDTHGPETHHSTFAKSRCTAIVERIIMKLVCKMISTVDYHVFGYEITMYYYAIHWEHWGR